MAPGDSIELDIKAMVIQALKQHIETIDWGDGMRLVFHAEDVPLGTGHSDLLLIDKADSVLYVAEIVVDEANAEDIGRLLGLCGWLKGMLLPAPAGYRPNNCPPDAPALFAFPSVTEIKGIILAKAFNAGAICAASLCPEIMAKRYNFSLQLGDL